VRDYQQHIGRWLGEAVQAVADSQSGTPIFRWRLRPEAKELRRLNDSTFTSVPMKSLQLGTQNLDAIEKSLVEVVEQTKVFADQVEGALGFENIDELVANQPQLILDTRYLERNDLTGPREKSAGLCFEIGLSGNLNDFFTWARKHPSDCPEAPAQPEALYGLECLEEYLKQKGRLGIKNEGNAAQLGHRLAIAYSYSEADPFDFADDESDFAFSLDRTEKHTGSLTYGFYFPKFQLPNLLPVGAALEPSGTARFDLKSNYDDVIGDPMRQSRFTATATLSQKMTDNTELSISAVWANKPEYRGEVDEELSANLGLKWQRDRPKK
jgi:hypothetical protein